MTEQTAAEVSALMAEHIEAEERELASLKDGQARLEEKVDKLLEGLSKNTEVCDEIRSLQTTGRVMTKAVKWIGGMAAAGAGIAALVTALKTGSPASMPPGPQ